MLEFILVALGSGGLSAALVKLYDIKIRHKEYKGNHETELRKELREDIVELRGYVKRLEENLQTAHKEILSLTEKNIRLELRVELYEKQYHVGEKERQILRLQIDELRLKQIKDA